MTIPTPPVNAAGIRTKKTAWARSVLIIALVFAGMLLALDTSLAPAGLHAPLSSLPLAMAGIGYAVFQLYIRPPRGALLKRLFLAATFLVWAVDQLLPPGRLAVFIGDAVIAAYVLDLYWLIQEQTTAGSSPSDSGDSPA
jgi:hypothetical protein